MSAVSKAELDTLAPPARRPGTPARFLLFLAAVAGSAVVLTVGFAPGARDRLPGLLLSLALALDAVFRPSRAVRDFCYAFPIAALFASISGSADPVAWPVLLFGGLAVGWTFRFLYDFETPPDPSRLDGPLRALAAVWMLATILALIRARTVWALGHGLSGRAVNGEGLLDAAAIRETVLTFAILAAGAAFFFVLRRSGGEVRATCARAALVGVALSAAVAILQAIGLFPGETRPFWRLTGRYSGGASDPNALGLLCGLGIVVLLGLAIGRPRERWAIGALLPLPIGLTLSGSRSGFLVAVLGSAAVIALASIRGRVRVALAVGAFALSVAVLLGRGSPGAVGGRVGSLFQSALSLDDRTSSRPILWRAALTLFSEAPVQGGGLGSFAWRLPDLVAAGSPRLPMRDNPGSAYLQALAETGLVGFALTLVFAAALARQAFARRRDPKSSGASAGLLAILLAFVVGSHWLAPEVSFLFFLLTALVAASVEPRPSRGVARIATALVALVLLYAAAALFAAARTADPAETFRYSRLIGFHPLETGPGGPFRWTGRNFAIWVRADAPEQLSLANYSPEGKAVEMTVRASDHGERVLYRRSLGPGEAVRLALWPGGRARAFLFELDRSFVPKRLTGSDDRRELGLLAVLPEDAVKPSR